MSTPLIHVRMAQVLDDCDAIKKGRKNQVQNFAFRGIDDVMNELHGAFARAKIYLTSNVLDRQLVERTTKAGGASFHHIVQVRYTFWAEDGSSVSTDTVGEAADTGDKGAGKAQSYALKVALLQAFLIPTEEDKDPDAHTTQFAAGNAVKSQVPVQTVSQSPKSTITIDSIQTGKDFDFRNETHREFLKTLLKRRNLALTDDGKKTLAAQIAKNKVPFDEVALNSAIDILAQQTFKDLERAKDLASALNPAWIPEIVSNKETQE